MTQNELDELERISSLMERVNVLCFKWGTLYPADFVNRLHAGVTRFLKRPFRFVCVTDDPTGLVEGIDAVPFPPAPEGYHRPWPDIFVKLLVFKDGFADLEGPTLFLDIDQIITGDLDCFFDYKPGEFCIIHNWIEWHKTIFRKRPNIGNSSCFRFEAGKSNHIYEKFLSEMHQAVDRAFYRTEQAYMTHAVGCENINWWPEGWVQSFKRSCTRPWPINFFLPPKFVPGTKILCFHGNPSPEQAIVGYTGGKHPNTVTRPAPWVKDLWDLALTH